MRTGASDSTSGASPVVTVAPVEGTGGAPVEVWERGQGAPVEVKEGSGLDAALAEASRGLRRVRAGVGTEVGADVGTVGADVGAG